MSMQYMYCPHGAWLDDFPNKHPLVVHFPIVLLLVAAAVQLCNILFLRKELD